MISKQYISHYYQHELPSAKQLIQTINQLEQKIEHLKSLLKIIKNKDHDPDDLVHMIHANLKNEFKLQIQSLKDQNIQFDQQIKQIKKDQQQYNQQQDDETSLEDEDDDEDELYAGEVNEPNKKKIPKKKKKKKHKMN